MISYYVPPCSIVKFVFTLSSLKMNFRNTAAELRKRAIQESKFLGGDMEHTHLVKGLDFALLQKVFLCFVCVFFVW